LIGFLANERIDPLRGTILAWCGTVLEQGGRLADEDTNRLAASLGRTDQVQRIPRVVFKHLWDWALERQRPEVVRTLLSLHLPPESRTFRQALLEGLMARLLGVRPSQVQKGTGGETGS
jgi:hypothetical protein